MRSLTLAPWHSLLAGMLLSMTFSCNHAGKSTDTPHTPTPQVPEPAHIVMEVNRLARLYTTEYQIHKIVTYSDAPTLEGTILGVPVKVNTRVGSRKVAIPIDVTLKAYIDFAEFSAAHVVRHDSLLVITLPDPHIVATSSKIDNRATRYYVDALRSRFTDAELTELARQGRDSILSHTAQLGIVQQAERSAVLQLMPVFRKMGFQDKNVTIRFRKQYTNSDLTPLIEKL